MRKNKIKNISLLLAGLFIFLNIALLVFHEESIYEKKAFIEEWSILPQHDLEETIAAEGVVQSEEETTVSFDPTQGTYMRTLVEEGDEIQEGEPIMEYQIHNYQNTERELQSQLTRIQAEIAAAESTLTELNNLDFSTDTTTIPSVDTTEEEDTTEEDSDEENSQEDDTVAAEYLKEEFRLETEQKIATLQAEEAAVESQLDQLETEGQSLSIPSSVTGTVTNIIEEEGGPAVTISSSDLVISGRLPEENRKQTSEGMPVKISGTPIDGKISELAEFPVTATIETESNYDFQVSPDEQMEELLPGYHTALEIVLAEKLNAAAVHSDQLTDDVVPTVWVMQENATLAKRELETGLEMNSWKEVVSGAEAGEPIVESPESRLDDGDIFVTSLETRFLDWNQIGNENFSFIERYPYLAGFLYR